MIQNQSNTAGPAGQPWADHAEALADWTLARVAVRRDVFGAYTPAGGQYTAHEPLTGDVLARHYLGERVVGVHLVSPDGLSLNSALDIDAHDDDADPGRNWRTATRSSELARELGLEPLVCDSNGRGGYHVRCFFRKPIPAAAAHWLGRRLVAGLQAEGFPACEAFPKQSELTLARPYGNWLRLPGKHHKRDHWTRIYDPERDHWLEGEAAVRRLLKVAGDDPSQLLTAWRAETEADKKPAPTRNGAADRRDYGPTTEDELRGALDALPAAYRDGYDSWLHTGMAIHAWDASRGLGLWEDWSRASTTKYQPGMCREKWATFSPGAGGLTVASIFGAARDAGWRPTPRAANASEAKHDVRVAAGKSDGGGRGDSGPAEGGDLDVRLAKFPRTDLGNAERLVARHGHLMRYCRPWGKWLIWDGRRWALDLTGAAERLAKATVRMIGREAATIDNDEGASPTSSGRSPRRSATG